METADRVAAAAAELYGADPQQFTDRRKALAAAAREAGDPGGAARIGALRKPTRAAWVLNRLARADPDAAALLAGLAAGLRAAEQAGDGRRLRELSAERGPLVDRLAGQALAAAGVADPPAGLREDITATLTSALADPEVAAAFAAGTLTRAAQWAGFGFGPPGPVPATAAGGEQVQKEQARKEQAGKEREQQRLAQEAAQAAARRREVFTDAERTVAAAAATAADAIAAEDRLEEEVRDLEERLTKARAQLADARQRARRAETAERRARQALDRLPSPGD